MVTPTETSTTQTKMETQNPLLAHIAKTDREILASRASRTVNGIQRQLIAKWNVISAEFLQLEDEYQTLIDLSPKTTVDLNIEVGDVNELVKSLSQNVESRHNLYNFQLKPLHDLMSNCFTAEEMKKYTLPTL